MSRHPTASERSRWNEQAVKRAAQQAESAHEPRRLTASDKWALIQQSAERGERASMEPGWITRAAIYLCGAAIVLAVFL